MKTILAALLLFSISGLCHADNDFCIAHEGRIVLHALPGCSDFSDNRDVSMYGSWEKTDGTIEVVCWSYEHMVHVLTSKGDLSFLPSDVRMDCRQQDLDDTHDPSGTAG